MNPNLLLWLGFFLIFVIGAVLYGRINRQALQQQGIGKHFFVMVFIAICGICTATFQPLAIEKIDVAHVGLKINLLGDERGVSKYQFAKGWAWYNKYTEEVVELPTFQQHVEYQGKMVVAKGGFQLPIDPTFNYELIADNAGDMYTNLRKPLEEIQGNWMATGAVGAMNDVANRWSVDSIFNNREFFESSVMREVDNRMGKWFRFSQIRTNITLPNELATAITAKTNAIQLAQAEQAQRQVIDMQNLNKIASARGDSAKAVIEAKGLAESIRIKKMEITPLYNEYLKITNWNGANPTTLVTSDKGAGVFVTTATGDGK